MWCYGNNNRTMHRKKNKLSQVSFFKISYRYININELALWCIWIESVNNLLIQGYLRNIRNFIFCGICSLFVFICKFKARYWPMFFWPCVMNSRIVCHCFILAGWYLEISFILLKHLYDLVISLFCNFFFFFYLFFEVTLLKAPWGKNLKAIIQNYCLYRLCYNLLIVNIEVNIHGVSLSVAKKILTS